ncbi:YtoQ family protein [Psychrobium sp. nBUS_13]|uniref:YtoQ family protein n=1 Tax=Psychrobium sp. nBUS_13 TaxID=3395319 RepID=UPI003EBE1AB0
MKQWNIYLSGEIHTNWRQQIEEGCRSLPVTFTSPVTNHDSSDAAGDHLGHIEDSYWRDHQSSKVNAIRTQTLIQSCDLAVIRFGEEYKQWNAAFDAGYCSALNKAYITLHSANIIHPLKEVDAMALAWAKTPDDVIKVIEYVVTPK